MKVAVSYRLPIGPIQASLALAAKERGFDVLEVVKGDNWTPMSPSASWDDYDVIIHFHNQPPTYKTSAKVLWWMCDLRNPKSMRCTTTASEIFICNLMYKDAYADHFNAETFYMPQCGNDVPLGTGRTLEEDVLFLGVVRPGRSFSDANPIDRDKLRALIDARDFHGNRSPVIEEIKKSRSVRVISREGLTEDQKWLYNRAPVSLSVSLPAKGYTSNRLYNILSAGGFALVNWFPGIEYLFENGRHLVWFKTPQEARELANRYSENLLDRDRIAQEGQKLYLSRDTAAHRVDYMLETL